MHSLGSSSKWPSCDSLASASSFILSESEQTEDETDMFSEGEGDGGMKRPLSADAEISLSRSYLDFPRHADQLRSKSKHDQTEFCCDEAKHPDPASSPRAATLRLSSATPGDVAFAQKCADLNRFIRPLHELLRGLKTGRFEKGLTSFQQSVAIDRLQRILGVLQKPEMGERYLQNVMQIEMLLKTWFPRESFKCKDTPNLSCDPSLAPQNQLHMPVKKRKLSWSDPDDPGRVPTKQNRHQHGKHEICNTATSLETISTSLPSSHDRPNTPEEETAEPAGNNSSAGDKFTDGAGPLSRSSFLCSRRETENLEPHEISLPSSCGSQVTQDCSVSSSDVTATTDSP